jgi:hypothetical protein
MSSNGSHNTSTNKKSNRSFALSLHYERGLIFMMAAIGFYSLFSIGVLILDVDNGNDSFAALATTITSDQTSPNRDVTSDAGNVSAPESLPLLPPPSAALPGDVNATGDITDVFNYLNEAQDAISNNDTQEALFNIDLAEISLKTLLSGDTGPALTPPNATATAAPSAPVTINATTPSGQNVTGRDAVNDTNAFP